MPPSLALWLTLAFIAFLFLRDFREKPNITAALWLPFLWIVVSPGSRFLSQWLAIFGFRVGGITVEDGSPIDAAFYFVLILAGMSVLYRRHFSLSEFIRNNRWLTLYLLFCLVAVSWSDFPYVSFKRWIKLLGDPVMALVILTEPNPLESLGRLAKRCAYFMLPVSILFIKYFPNLGRLFDQWSGAPMNTGITTNKNELGFDCWILGMLLFWRVLQVLQWNRKAPSSLEFPDEPPGALAYRADETMWEPISLSLATPNGFGGGDNSTDITAIEPHRSFPGTSKRRELILCSGLFAMDLWLLKEAHSMTSLVAFMLGTGLMLFLGVRWIDKRRIGAWLLTGTAAFVVVGLTFGLVADFIHLLGRNETLTGRTQIWHLLWNWHINPVIGAGFEGFWLGDRRETIQGLYPGLNEAHNGYLETYLNLGFIGVAITFVLLLVVYTKCRRELFHNFEFGRFRLAFLISFIFYNWTEAAFRLNAFPFFVFFLIAIDYAGPERVPELEPAPLLKESAFHLMPGQNWLGGS